jgi:hypothetical protein
VLQMAKGTQWVLSPIVHVQGFPPSVVQVSEVDITFDWLKTKFMLKQGLKEDDFVYYVSSLHSDGPGERKFIEITDDDTIHEMLKEWEWKRVVDLHCYRKPSYM